MLDVVAGTRQEAMVVVALGLDLRQGELLGLSWADVDMDRGELQVRHALQRIKGEGLRLVDVTTNQSSS